MSKTVPRNTSNKYQNCIDVDLSYGTCCYTKCKALYHKDQVNYIFISYCWNDKYMRQLINL